MKASIKKIYTLKNNFSGKPDRFQKPVRFRTSYVVEKL